MGRLQTSKVWSLLVLLSEEEDREFADWLCSPVHCRVKIIPQLFAILLRYKRSDHPLPTKQRLYEKLYPDQSFRSSTINNLLRELTAQLEAYLAWKGMETAGQSDYFYLRELRMRGENHHFFKDAAPQFEAILHGTRQVDYLRDLQWIQLLYYHPAFEGKYEVEYDYWSLMNRALDGYYLEQRLALQHELVNKAHAEKNPPPPPLPSWFETLLLQSPGSPAMTLYRYRLERTPAFTYADFDHFYGMYLTAFDRLLFQERVVFLTCLTNDAVTLITRGEAQAYPALFSLYRFALREELIFKGGGLSPIMFNNIVSVALHEQQLSFVQEFIHQARRHLFSGWKTDALNWARGRLALAEEDPRRCLQYFSQHAPQYWLYKFHSRLIELLAHADLVFFHGEESTAFFSHAQAFAKFVRRENNHRIRHDRFLHTIQLFKIMVRSFERDTLLTSKEKFQQHLDDKQPAYGTEWIQERLRRIEQQAHR